MIPKEKKRLRKIRMLNIYRKPSMNFTNEEKKITKFQVLRFGPNESIKNETVYFTEDMIHIIEQVNKT